eukprot:2314880-Amphidinium_carterae.1
MQIDGFLSRPASSRAARGWLPESLGKQASSKTCVEYPWKQIQSRSSSHEILESKAPDIQIQQYCSLEASTPVFHASCGRLQWRLSCG